MNEDLDFRLISTKQSNANIMAMCSPTPPSSLNIFSLWSDYLQRSPMTPLSSEEEDPLFQQRLLVYQKILHQEFVVEPTITLPSIESAQLNLECQAPSQNNQLNLECQAPSQNNQLDFECQAHSQQDPFNFECQASFQQHPLNFECQPPSQKDQLNPSQEDQLNFEFQTQKNQFNLEFQAPFQDNQLNLECQAPYRNNQWDFEFQAPSQEEQLNPTQEDQLNFEFQAQENQADIGGISLGKASKSDKSHSGEKNKRRKTTAHIIAHNVSEKRRRERFNERIKILQGLLPVIEKKDTTSILEEAVKQIGLLKYQAQWMQEHQFMIPPGANVLGMMMPYSAMLQYPAAAAAMLPQLQMQMQMQQMMQYMRQSPQLFPPYAAPCSSMAAAPKIALPPNPSAPSTDQVTTNVSGQAETTNRGAGGRVGKKKKR